MCVFEQAETLEPVGAGISLWPNALRALDAIGDVPLTGMGYNGFRRVMPVLYPTLLTPTDVDIGHAHNIWLQVALDIGLPGAAAYCWLWLSAAVTGLAVPVGVAIALALRDPRLPGRDFWRAAVLLPLLVPDFVLAYSWLRAYARAGLTSEAFGFAWPQVQGPVGVTVIVASQAVPLVYLITVVGLSTRAEPATERAGRPIWTRRSGWFEPTWGPRLRCAISTGPG